MRVDVLAVGTELLLGQIVDTNSSWIGEQLAAFGMDTYEHRKIGDNLDRMVRAMHDMLEECDALIVCGGLGPTPDDVTREAIAVVMGVELERHEELIDDIRAIFSRGGREMTANNLRQADIPRGGEAIHNPIGTAPGLRCEVRDASGRAKLVYAVPGVPHEMQRMVGEDVIPDLLAQSGERAVIVSRSLRTWGTSESGLAELIAHRVDVQTNPTIAFLARGIEGLYVRITAKAATEGEALALLDAEDQELRAVLGQLVFGVDDESMEAAVLHLCEARGWTLGVAESMTGGLVGARLANVPGASKVYRGSVASYATEVKRAVLGVKTEHVVSAEAAKEMAEAARRVLGADVGISVTGAAGPDGQDGHEPGTAFYGLALPGMPAEAVAAQHMRRDRDFVRNMATISLLNLVRMRLLALP